MGSDNESIGVSRHCLPHLVILELIPVKDTDADKALQNCEPHASRFKMMQATDLRKAKEDARNDYYFVVDIVATFNEKGYLWTPPPGLCFIGVL